MPAYLLLLLPLAPLQEVVAHWIAESRIAIEQIRLLTLKAAHTIDTLGNAGAIKQVRPLVPPSVKPALDSPSHWALQAVWCLDGIQKLPCDFGLKITDVWHLL